MIDFIIKFSYPWRVRVCMSKLVSCFDFICSFCRDYRDYLLILPEGMQIFEALLIIFRKLYSPLWTFIGGSIDANFSSVIFVNLVQFAFLKFVNVLLSLVVNLISVSRVITIGRWSEPRVFCVVQSVYGRRDKEAKDMSGAELLASPDGILVAEPSLSTPKLDVSIVSEIRLPL